MSYVDGMIAVAPAGNREAYRAFAIAAAAIFKDHGATRLVDCWQDDVPHGRTTDFHRAVAAREGEAVIFSWIEWPSKAARDAGMAAAMADARMRTPPADMPFDGKRMIFGGFEPILDI